MAAACDECSGGCTRRAGGQKVANSEKAPKPPVLGAAHRSSNDGIAASISTAALGLTALLGVAGVTHGSELRTHSATTNEHTLETVTVVGTRTERTLGEVAASISVYDREDIERRLVRDIQDLVRYEPGVSVGGTGSRFGLEGFSIRGVGGNRVLTLIDGIRMPEEFSFGPFLSSRRDFVDVDTISRVEIARGPVSTLYGSDALGGVVAITTRAPNDYVGADKNSYLDLKAGYNSEDDSVVGAANLALGNETLAGLLTYTYRAGQETETFGNVGGTGQTRTLADPQDIDTETLGFKLAWSPAQGHNIIAAVDVLDGTTDTDLLSDTGLSVRGVLTDSRVAADDRRRERFSLGYRFTGDGWIDSAFATAYLQSAQTTQRTFEERTAGGGLAQTRVRDSLFEQEISGIFAQASSRFNLATTAHTLTYGIDIYRTENSSIRTGSTVDLATSQQLPEFNPLPTRDFPLTEVENRAFFLQDEIVLLDGRLRVTPGLRFDDYQAVTSPDSIYFSGNPGVSPPEDFADSALTLKLGVLYQFTKQVSAWARYSEGFRAPPYDDVNVGFSNFIGGYKTIAAPGLEAESSEGYELGLRVQGDAGSLQLAVFDTVYDNFIQALTPSPLFARSGGIDPNDGLLTFQSVNLDEVAIAGVELRAAFALGSVHTRLSNFYLDGAAAYATGEDQNGVPVETIDPMSAVLGLRWAPVSLPLETELIWTWSARKDEEDIVNPRPATDSFNVLDLLVHVEINDRWQLDAGVFNVFDEAYIRWADTAGIGEDAVDRFTRPGRNFSLTLRASL